MSMKYSITSDESRLLCLVRDRGSAGEIFPVFRRIIYNYYRHHGRELPWRVNPTPYRVFVSEIMLQQTQAGRVAGKFGPFVEAFPDFNSLASAAFSDVLELWTGLGYNRRALALMKSARMIMDTRGGVLPSRREDLAGLPGIGPATAASIAVFAYNLPEVFLETNIRTVLIHFFFADRVRVADAEIIPLAEQSLDKKNPRKWYNALMDYGVMLKKAHGNPGRKSATYTIQGPFKNSRRQIRGSILKELLVCPLMDSGELARRLGIDCTFGNEILAELEHEGFILRNGKKYRLV